MTDASALPPRPDPETGEPFPPAGRGWSGNEQPPEQNPHRETRLSHKPSPPEGFGPVLTWHKHSRRGKAVIFGGSAMAFVVGTSLVQAINGAEPFAWMSIWYVWAIILVVSLLIASPLTYVVTAAGADWFLLEHVRFGVTVKRGHIKLYELTSIMGTIGSAASVNLDLADDTNSIFLAKHEWQRDRRMWNLVYNGILHSVAAGAKINRSARGILHLDDEPAMQPDTGPIVTADLTDQQVKRLMKDREIRRVTTSINFSGGLDEFRAKFPEIPRDILDDANPTWMTREDNTH